MGGFSCVNTLRDISVKLWSITCHTCNKSLNRRVSMVFCFSQIDTRTFSFLRKCYLTFSVDELISIDFCVKYLEETLFYWKINQKILTWRYYSMLTRNQNIIIAEILYRNMINFQKLLVVFPVRSYGIIIGASNVGSCSYVLCYAGSEESTCDIDWCIRNGSF